jgi:hypothetical protein
MSNRTYTILLVCVCLIVGGMQSLWSQSVVVGQGIPGYLDPRTGAFHPAQPQAAAGDDENAAAARTTHTGSLQTTLKFAVKSKLPAGPIVCVLVAEVLDINKSTGVISGAFSEFGSAIATVTAGQATCSPKFTYGWTLVNDAGVSFIYQINGPPQPGGALSRITGVESTIPAVPVSSLGTGTFTVQFNGDINTQF